MKFEVTISEELQRKLSRCYYIERVASPMLNESALIIVDSVKKQLSKHSTAGAIRSKVYWVSALDGNRVFKWKQTGALSKSLRRRRVKRAKDGGYIKKIEFAGHDSNGVPNEFKAIQLEYGNSAQAPTPFRTAAINDCKGAVAEKMQEVYNREMGLDK